MNADKTGRYIAELRKQKNLTQAELADRIHVSDKAISRWETGRGFPDINNLEALSEALDISVAELLKGESISESITKEELMVVSTESISFTKDLLKRNKYINLLIGFLLSLCVLTLAFVHLNSPIYIEGASNAIEIEELSDGRIAGILSENVSGYEVGTIEEPDSNDGKSLTFVSCYETRWSQIRGKKNQSIILFGAKEDIGNIYYYPTGKDYDQLIYGIKDNDSFAGIATLPRLVYNYWMLIGAFVSVIGIVLFLIFRKRYFARTLLKIIVIPIAFTVSIPLCLMGHFGEIYNAGFYFTGIVLLTLIISAVLWLILSSTTKATWL